MASGSTPQNRNRWLTAIGYGLLAEIATIITIVIIVSIYRYGIARGLSPDAYAAFGEKTGGVVGIIGGTLYTYIFARLLTRALTENFVAHGIVVAAAAIALSVGGSIAGHQSVPVAYILASLLKLTAGWFAGFQSRKPAAVA
ncbi:MAG TPA: hypothetical protein VJ840_06935 [Gemmatimonadaceae bacterium]|nr:hypothetical protein [Gemmatimonadaceae bacterium]